MAARSIPVLLVAFCAPLQTCAYSYYPHAYDVNVRYSCLQFDGTTGVCSKWQQKADFQYDRYGVNCFPGDAAVISDRGLLPMTELSIGDKVLGKDKQTGLPTFSAVRGWLHRSPLRRKRMTRVHLEGGATFVASNGHMLAVASSWRRKRGRKEDALTCLMNEVVRYSRTAELRPKDCLVSSNGSAVVVEWLEPVQMKGVFSPFTWQSNFFVVASHSLGGESVHTGSIPEAVLAHSFSSTKDPERYEWLWHSLLSVVETLFFPSLHSPQQVPSSLAYMHPVLGVWMRLWGDDHLQADDLAGELKEDSDSAIARRLGKYSSYRSSASSSSDSERQAEEFQMFQIAMFQMASLPPFMAIPPVKPQSPMQDLNLTSKDVGDLEIKEVWQKNLEGALFWLCLGIVCCICGIVMDSMKNR